MKDKIKRQEWKSHTLLFECSAVDGTNVKKAFDCLITKILMKKGVVHDKEKGGKKWWQCRIF
jgi:hypothetical protein